SATSCAACREPHLGIEPEAADEIRDGYAWYETRQPGLGNAFDSGPAAISRQKIATVSLVSGDYAQVHPVPEVAK
ncbi:MAG: hypothetical protein AAGF11_47215, partial [Myxococcota bacterium]